MYKLLDSGDQYDWSISITWSVIWKWWFAAKISLRFNAIDLTDIEVIGYWSEIDICRFVAIWCQICAFLPRFDIPSVIFYRMEFLAPYGIAGGPVEPPCNAGQYHEIHDANRGCYAGCAGQCGVIDRYLITRLIIDQKSIISAFYLIFGGVLFLVFFAEYYC